MGANITVKEKQILEQESPNLEEWMIKQETDFCNIYCHRMRPCVQIEEYPINIFFHEQIEHEYDIFKLRKHHKYFVASLYLSCIVKENGCSTQKQVKIYLQRISTRLYQVNCKFKFPEVLHLYHQVLQGYKELTHDEKIKHFFQINDKMIGINQAGVVKVWMNSHFEKSRELIQSNEQFEFVDQQQMVSKIIKVLKGYTEFEKKQELSALNQHNQLFNNLQVLNFSKALSLVDEIARQFNNGVIPKNIPKYYFKNQNQRTEGIPLYSKLKRKLINNQQMAMFESKRIGKQIYGFQQFNRASRCSYVESRSLKGSVIPCMPLTYSTNMQPRQRIKTQLAPKQFTRSGSQPYLFVPQIRVVFDNKNKNQRQQTLIGQYIKPTINPPNHLPQNESRSTSRSPSPFFYRHITQISQKPFQGSDRLFGKIFPHTAGHNRPIQQNSFLARKPVQSNQHGSVQKVQAKKSSEKPRNSTSPHSFELNDSFKVVQQGGNQVANFDFTFQDQKEQQLNSSTKDFYNRLFTNDTFEDKNQVKEQQSLFSFLKSGKQLNRNKRVVSNHLSNNPPLPIRKQLRHVIPSSQISPVIQVVPQVVPSRITFVHNGMLQPNPNKLLFNAPQVRTTNDRFWDTAKNMNAKHFIRNGDSATDVRFQSNHQRQHRFI